MANMKKPCPGIGDTAFAFILRIPLRAIRE